MDRLYKVKVWKDRMAKVYPAKWCWEVSERSNAGKTIGCGTTFSESKSREAATRVVEERLAYLKERLAFAEMSSLRAISRPEFGRSW